jgi:hypothetical protein
MAYEIEELATGFELTGTGKDKGTTVKVAKLDVERIAGDDQDKVKAELCHRRQARRLGEVPQEPEARREGKARCQSRRHSNSRDSG